MRDETFMRVMRLLPRSALSRAAGSIARAKVPAPVHRALMRGFARAFEIDMGEAELGFEGYPTLADFFARKLKPGRRTVEGGERVVSSPVDGAISQLGYVKSGQCVQAKGIEYPIGKLLGDEAAAHAPLAKFEGGAFATLYLSPRDYHRIHAPLGGRILGYSYIPGEFWPVNRHSVRALEAVFCLNERLVTYLDTPAGLLALVAVGATCVSRIRASYDEAIVTHAGEPARAHRYDPPIPIRKGEEVGRFEMGSTVILLFEAGRVRWADGLGPEAVVRMGMRLGELT